MDPQKRRPEIEECYVFKQETFLKEVVKLVCIIAKSRSWPLRTLKTLVTFLNCLKSAGQFRMVKF